MAMATECAGCGAITSWIFAAQFSHKEQHEIICSTCYENGVRCWFHEDQLVIGKEPVGVKAVLYWDEGGFVTGGKEEITYPQKDQPQ